MTVLPILQYPDPRLRQRCDPVTEFDTGLLRLADDMLETMYKAKGRGLAGPQVSVMKRIFVMDLTWKDGTPEPGLFFNPRIVKNDAATGWAAPTDQVVNLEGCLSIPDRPVRISRPAFVRMAWQDHAGRDHIGNFDGFAAVCVQHEMDHLDGILCIDYPNILLQTEDVA